MLHRMYVNVHNTVTMVNFTNFFCSFFQGRGYIRLVDERICKLSNRMACESCSFDIDPEKTMTMTEDVLDCSDSVDNEQLVSIKEMFYIHLDAPLTINGLEILAHVCEKAVSSLSSKDNHCDRECIHPSTGYFAEELFTSFS